MGENPPMEHNYLHVFRLAVDGVSEPYRFEMFYESDDVTEATDAAARYIARQEDNFLPIGPSMAVRANRVVRVEHAGVEPRLQSSPLARAAP